MTGPQSVLVTGLSAGGALFGAFLLTIVKPLPASPTPPPAPPVFSCNYGQILVPPSTCINLSPGNVDLNLSKGSRFSTPNSEIARLTVVSGRVRINNIYNSSEAHFYSSGQTIDISANHIVTAIEPNTKLLKRAW